MGTIKGYGEAVPLKAGVLLEADIVQESRAVWEWVFEPLLAARQQLRILRSNPNDASL